MPISLDTDLWDLELSIRSINALSSLECKTVADVVQTSPLDLLLLTTATSLSVREIEEEVLQPLDRSFDWRKPPRRLPEVPQAPAESFGALYVWERDRDWVRDAVIRAYAAEGLELQKGSVPYGYDALQINPAEALGEDEVVLAPVDGWCGIMSERWELAPAGRHPLARRLSEKAEVLSLTAVKDQYVEVSRYISGELAEQTLHGTHAHESTGAPEVDLAVLASRSDFLERYLRAVLGLPHAFCNLMGFYQGGYECRQDGGFQDVEETDLMVFKAKTSRV